MFLAFASRGSGNTMIQELKWKKAKPFFLYKVSEEKPDIHKLKKEYKNIKVYFEPVHNTRTGKTGYAIYLTKRITWY